MKYYKEMLFSKLVQSGWEIIHESDNTEWWLESSWKIRSIKQNYGLECFILFLVDPQYEGNDKSSAVWAIEAFKNLPSARPLNTGVAAMNMIKGQFDVKLSVFVNELNEYRASVCS
ncbi:hypothetical protein [Pseudoalteromonas sp. McH1-42]|uniref:hypothetical protein n=1 Tax=Pseudoalteromonas sp. McH1-42 TaxID=2917752 RepID=UPI001EF5B498|nr:hypothetical protein [Pseudoalteromonas sp. McH1-42]MCG7563099.1 hypothetical protein [Pseudoalteromonas sp. McH1-42]